MLSLSLWHVRSHVHSEVCIMISLPDLIKALSSRIRIRLKTQLFKSVFKKIRVHSLRFRIVFAHPHTYTMNRFENDSLPDCACLTHTCSLLWAREIINWRHLWISLVWRSSKSQKQFKMSKSGQKQSQTKGRSNLPPLDTGSESNLITDVLPPSGIIS